MRSSASPISVRETRPFHPQIPRTSRKNESTKLGSTDLQVTRLGYGAARIDAIPVDEAETLLNTLLDEGITFIDTADCYGDSEELIGRFLGARMQECVVATKCGCLVLRRISQRNYHEGCSGRQRASSTRRDGLWDSTQR